MSTQAVDAPERVLQLLAEVERLREALREIMALEGGYRAAAIARRALEEPK